MAKMKSNIIEAGSKYQIGGLPNHRVEEHLILIDRGINKVGGAIAELMDIETFF